LRVLSPSTGNNFFVNLFLYSIEMPSPGLYKFSIFSFIHCAYPNCENANDYILIRTNEFKVGYKELIRIDFSKGRIRDEKWILNEAYFSIGSIENFFVRSTSFAPFI
jgi:hypothetical protein